MGQENQPVGGSGKSVELCGGTHVDNTAKVGPFRIVSESSVASGVRRIEAVTGKACMCQAETDNSRLSQVASLLHTKPVELLTKAESFMAELKSMRQDMERLRQEKFKITDEIHQVESPTGIGASISIGLGIDGENFGEVLQFADMASELALSRGLAGVSLWPRDRLYRPGLLTLQSCCTGEKLV